MDRFLNQIICGDCLEVMRELPDKSVDAVATDPPYGVNFPYLSYDDTRQSLKELIKRFIPEFFQHIAKDIYPLWTNTNNALP